VPATLLARWALYYADHKVLSIAITYLHLAGVLIGGGAAITLDRMVLSAAGAGRQLRDEVLARLTASHGTVVTALGIVVTTGALMVTADRETFFESNVFYVKMALVALLLLNGTLLLASERRARASESGWWMLTMVSTISLVLWLATLLAGAWLQVAA